MIDDSLLALMAFAFATSITPGPNNLMLMASGANFGVRRTIPHMLGIGIGFTVMIVLVGLGLIRLFDAWPLSYAIMKGAALAYLVWLAWKIARTGAPEESHGEARPLTFLQAAAFQWVNPKAMAMALTAVTVYAPDRGLASILLVAAVFGAINLPSVSVWAAVGQVLRRWLGNPARLRLFNWTMAGLLVLSMIPLL